MAKCARESAGPSGSLDSERAAVAVIRKGPTLLSIRARPRERSDGI